jgi:hypothetical protein
MASFLLIAGTIASLTMVNAAPNIPPGEMPGRERERFMPSPVDRFTDPSASPRQAEPLFRWCDEKPPKRTKRKQGKSESAAEERSGALPFLGLNIALARELARRRSWHGQDQRHTKGPEGEDQDDTLGCR